MLLGRFTELSNRHDLGEEEVSPDVTGDVC